MPRVAELSPPVGKSVIADRCRERRGPEGLLSLDKVLLHNEAVADGWNQMLGAIRTKLTIPGDLRELLILRVAVLNGAQYEWAQHEPVARQEGCTEQQISALLKDSLSDDDFKPELHLPLTLADCSTRDIHVPHTLFEACREYYTEAQVQEIIMVIAAYNMVSRYLVALDVGDMVSQPLKDLPDFTHVRHGTRPGVL